jgi:hypothetical protein
MKKEAYVVLTKLDDDGIKHYVMNKVGKCIHSIWDSIIDARKTANDLNRVTGIMEIAKEAALKANIKIPTKQN